MDLIGLIKQKKYTIISVFLIFLVVGLLFLLTQDFKYGTKSKILVIQEGAGKVDPYSVSRSIEYLSDLFTKVVYSNSFFESVMKSDFDIDESYFGSTSNDMTKQWKKTVSAKALEDSGIIIINVYHKDNYQATQIALAINHVLITGHQNYHGLGDSVKINVIDQPVVSNYPVKPNLIYNFIIILAGSLFFSLVYIYLFPEKKYDINLFLNRPKKEIKIEPVVDNKVNNNRLINNLDYNEIQAKTETNNLVDNKIKETIDFDEIKRSGDINNLFE
ncbi:MAG TPA: hypothetical protein PLE28_03155 [bacterium]|nr:hypothetical protein [bacterium]